jgi:hypothetical protein
MIRVEKLKKNHKMSPIIDILELFIVQDSVKYFYQENKIFVCLNDIVNHFVQSNCPDKYIFYNFKHKFTINNLTYTDVKDVLDILIKSKNQKIKCLYNELLQLKDNRIQPSLIQIQTEKDINKIHIEKKNQEIKKKVIPFSFNNYIKNIRIRKCILEGLCLLVIIQNIRNSL